MNKRTVSIAALCLGALLAADAGAQTVTTPSGADTSNPNRVLPSEAATVKTPGTPGASDTPGALQASGHDDRPAAPSASEVRKLKKQARKATSSAPASSAPSK